MSNANNTDSDLPWNVPSIRIWEIDGSSSRYDKLIAAPSDDAMQAMWFAWSGIMAFTVVVIFVVFTGIICSPKTRKNPFNKYLLCLMIPDGLMTLPCFITCLTNGLEGRFTSEWACKAQSVYFIWGIGANAWLNAVICRQLYLMLRAAQHFQRYKPPSTRKVILDSLACYAWAAFVASWSIWDVSWLPHKTYLVNGTACVPMDYNVASTLFFYLVFFPAIMGIPLIIVCYIGVQVYRQKLLPPTGKRRVLAIYFFRLAAVFVVMWFPALLFFFILGAWMGHWTLWAGGAWAHLQGAVSAIVSLMKPDIKAAVGQLWCPCAHCTKEQKLNESAQESSTRLSVDPRRGTVNVTASHAAGNSTGDACGETTQVEATQGTYDTELGCPETTQKSDITQQTTPTTLSRVNFAGGISGFPHDGPIHGGSGEQDLNAAGKV